MSVVVANAPVSYGVFELTVGSDCYLAPAERLLDEVANAGYAGIDLGPLGYLGSGTALGARLATRGLGLAGAYLELPYEDDVALSTAWPELEALLDQLDLLRGMVDGPPARPTLAAGPRQGSGLTAAAARQFASGVARVATHCRERGHEPTFHHHVGSWIETPAETEWLLEMTDVGLCLDTGHLMVGGGDPVAAFAEWAGRINQVHLKDARLDLLAAIRAEDAPTSEIWKRGVWCPLAAGDLDLDGVLAALQRIGYDGWLVVEQDVFTTDKSRFEQAVLDQQANRRLLAAHGL